MSATQDNAVVPESFSTSVMASSALFIGLALLMLGNGLQGSLLGVRASQEDFGSGVIGLFMGAMICGGALLQWPLGRLSDRIDRRLVILGVTFAAAGSSLLAYQATGWATPWMLPGVGLFGGLAFALHSLNLAHTNDCLKPSEMLGASSSLVLLLGIGSVIGPLAVGAVMSQVGAGGFFWWLAAVQVGFGIFGLGCVRYFAKRASVEPSDYVVVPSQTSSVGAAAIEDVYATQECEQRDESTAEAMNSETRTSENDNKEFDR